MFCSECGEKLIENDKFCSKCGKENIINSEVVKNNDLKFKHDSNVKSDIAMNNIAVLFLFYVALSMIFVGGSFMNSVGFGSSPILITLPIILVVYLIQKIRKLKYQRPVLHTVIISAIIFIMSIMGTLGYNH